MLSRAQKTHVREKFKESTIQPMKVQKDDIIIIEFSTVQSLSIQTIRVKTKYRIITAFNKKFNDIYRIF